MPKRFGDYTVEAEAEEMEEQKMMGSRAIHGKTTILRAAIKNMKVDIPLHDIHPNAPKGTMLIPTSIQVKASVSSQTPPIIGIHVKVPPHAESYVDRDNVHFRHGKYHSNITIVDTREREFVSVYAVKENMPGLTEELLAADPDRLQMAIAKHTAGNYFVLPVEDRNNVIERLRQRIPNKAPMQEFDGRSARAFLREQDASADVSWIEDNMEYVAWELRGSPMMTIMHALNPWSSLPVVHKNQPLELHFIMPEGSLGSAVFMITWEAREPSKIQFDPLMQVASGGTRCKFKSLALANDVDDQVIVPASQPDPDGYYDDGDDGNN